MAVKQIGNDIFEVTDFTKSLPHLVYQVRFVKNEAVVISRTGCVSKEWDRHAVSVVQHALITQTVGV